MLGYVNQHSLDAVALRLSWIYRPGRRTLTTLEDILRAGLTGRAIGVDAAPDDITHYLYIGDAVDGLICAGLTPTLVERVYNITAGQGVPTRHVVEIIERLGPKFKITLLRKDTAGGPASLENHRAARVWGFVRPHRLSKGCGSTGMRFWDETASGVYPTSSATFRVRSAI